MLLLSVEKEERKVIYADLFDIDRSLQSKANPLSPIYVEGFTDSHMIKLVHEDKQKKQAIFVTQTKINLSTDVFFSGRVNKLIDSVTVFKLVLGAKDKLF